MNKPRETAVDDAADPGLSFDLVTARFLDFVSSREYDWYL